METKIQPSRREDFGHGAGAIKTPSIVVIETQDHLRETSIRIAQALARPQTANVFLVDWDRFHFSNDMVSFQGPVHCVKGCGIVEDRTILAPLPVRGMFFYRKNCGELIGGKAAALESLSAAGITTDGAPIHKIVDGMMLEASRRGVITNALGSSDTWGPKHCQELQLRRYESATGQTIPRPETHIARPDQMRRVLSIFARRGQACLVKPAFGSLGRGFHIVRPGSSFQSNDIMVVQRLIPNPLLVDGHKADIRFYLLIDVDNDRVSGRLSPIFIRRAAFPYVAQSLPAEITNTSYRLRLGLAPDIRPIQPMPGISEHSYSLIISQLDSLARALVNAHFWNAEHKSVETDGCIIPNRTLLLGIDALVAIRSSGPRVYFLESNPFPLLYRGTPDCDEAIDQMLSREYLPLLTRLDKLEARNPERPQPALLVPQSPDSM
ncbi:MAG: hypothetical protein JO223_24325 [Hyphomicrobiales bacterium]|nr:hypothetical protein [Hyphomicrobiales bacterium]